MHRNLPPQIFMPSWYRDIQTLLCGTVFQSEDVNYKSDKSGTVENSLMICAGFHFIVRLDSGEWMKSLLYTNQ